MILGTRSEHREPYLARPRHANPSPVSRRGEAHGAERSPPRRRWESARRRRWRARRRRHQITGERGQQRGHAPRPRRAKFVLVFLAIKKKWSGLWRGGGRKKGGGGEPKALEAGARGHGVLPGGAGRVRMAAVCGRWARGLGPASRVAVACGSCWTSRASAVSAWWGRGGDQTTAPGPCWMSGPRPGRVHWCSSAQGPAPCTNRPGPPGLSLPPCSWLLSIDTAINQVDPVVNFCIDTTHSRQPRPKAQELMSVQMRTARGLPVVSSCFSWVLRRAARRRRCDDTEERRKPSARAR